MPMRRSAVELAVTNAKNQLATVTKSVLGSTGGTKKEQKKLLKQNPKWRRANALVVALEGRVKAIDAGEKLTAEVLERAKIPKVKKVKVKKKPVETAKPKAKGKGGGGGKPAKEAPAKE